MPTSSRLSVVSCCWVFTIKHHSNGTMDIYKALVARDFIQTYGVDYLKTFCLVARLNSIRVLFSLIVDHQWPIF